VQLTRWELLAYALILAIQIIFDQFILILLPLPALLRIGAALQLFPQEDKSLLMLIRSYEGPGRCYNNYGYLPFFSPQASLQSSD
jgi:hypothetical protein